MSHQTCPDCVDLTKLSSHTTRRDFIRVVGAGVAAASVPQLPGVATAEDSTAATSESLVKKLYDTLTPAQKDEICFDWDHKDDRGILRTHVSNNWNITETSFNVGGNFYSKEQQDIIEAMFWGLYNPEWHDRIRKQLKDDAGGYGKAQTLAIFGTPGSDKFELVMTGRHLTIRCDGNTTEHVAFGGPIFYGHAAAESNEPANHTGNVFWHQALKANDLYKMLDGKQRNLALIEQAPAEKDVPFRGTAEIPGLPISELSADQRQHAEDVLKVLLEPYRMSDQQEARELLKTQGGLDKCRIAFYKSGDLGNDGIWDNWRLEGPSFVWHYRGAPHVHVWVNIADDASVPLNARG